MARLNHILHLIAFLCAGNSNGFPNQQIWMATSASLIQVQQGTGGLQNPEALRFIRTQQIAPALTNLDVVKKRLVESYHNIIKSYTGIIPVFEYSCKYRKTNCE